MRLEDGKLINIDFHNERMMNALRFFYNITSRKDLYELIEIPPFAEKGVFKCRVEYDTELRKVEFLPYSIKPVSTLKLVEEDNIEYPYKLTDRRNFEKLLLEKEGCDDILIIKNGMVTDTSYANVVFRDINCKWVTPSTFLLPGTRRASLLYSGIINEVSISCKEIFRYSEVRLINAMMGIEDTAGIPVSNII